MKRSLYTIAFFGVLLSILSFTVPAMKVARHSIKFSTFGVSGTFKSFSGTIAFDEKNLDASRFDVVIDVNSISTSFDMQDKHAKGEDWFNAPKYPSIRFVSKRILKDGANYKAIGNLSMHGYIKEVTLPFSYKPTVSGGTFQGTFEVNRNDFKIGEPGGLVGEDIEIKVTVPVVK